MRRYIEGLDQRQGFLLPDCVDDYVGEENPIRVIEAFVDRLDLAELRFDRAIPAEVGRPGYHPAVLLKRYLYGYLNRIASSRRLEREAQRNLEVMWLTGRLVPDFKTIADFRRDNGAAIRGTCRQFVLLCRELDLFSDTLVAIDGSKFKAVNTRDKNFTPAKLRNRIEQIEESIARYMAAMDTADRQEDVAASSKAVRLSEKIDRLKEQMRKLRDLQVEVNATPDRQISLTDPDARSMATSGKGTSVVGYNLQTAVDAEHHLIVAHEVTNVGHDREELVKMATQAKEAMGQTQIAVLADRGYFSGLEVYRCEESGIVPYVPKPLTSSAKSEAATASRTSCISPADVYRCPAGEELTWRYNRLEDGKVLRHYWTTKCQGCAMKAACTTGKERRIKRWEHEDVLDAMQRCLDRVPQAMAIRRQTAEHAFGTIKAWMGATHFLTQTLSQVRTEMSLQVLAYNMKRLIAILGIRQSLAAIQA
jgi:transposase